MNQNVVKYQLVNCSDNQSEFKTPPVLSSPQVGIETVSITSSEPRESGFEATTVVTNKPQNAQPREHHVFASMQKVRRSTYGHPGLSLFITTFSDLVNVEWLDYLSNYFCSSGVETCDSVARNTATLISLMLSRKGQEALKQPSMYRAQPS